MIAVQPARALGTLNTVLQEGGASLLRLDEILRKENKIILTRNSRGVDNIKSKYSFQNVSFSYDNKYKSLNSLNLKIKEKENLVLVGNNGSGKTTFLNLIPRLIDPSKGNITIDGINIKLFDISKLRSIISLVSQDIILFDLSILENLKLANKKATFKDIEEVCRVADAHNFIKKFKKGYQTVVGDRRIKVIRRTKTKNFNCKSIIKKT